MPLYNKYLNKLCSANGQLSFTDYYISTVSVITAIVVGYCG